MQSQNHEKKSILFKIKLKATLKNSAGTTESKARS